VIDVSSLKVFEQKSSETIMIALDLRVSSQAPTQKLHNLVLFINYNITIVDNSC